MARGGGNKKRFRYCFDSSGEILHLWALPGHSGRNLIDSSLQDNVIISDGFFKYIYHVGCTISLHSIMNSGLIPGGRNLSKRQTVFFMPVNPMNKEHKDPETVDLKAPRLAHYMHTAWKKHQNTVYWVDIKLAQKKGLKFYQTRSNAIILYDTPSLLYPEGYHDGIWRNHLRKRIWITSTASEDFLETWLDEGIGFRSCSTSRGQPTNPTKPNPNHERTVTEQTSRSSAQEIDTLLCLDCKNTNLFVERLEKDKDTDKDVDADRDRTGRPVVSGQPTGSSTQLEEVDIDFRVSGLPHAVVKQAENFSCSRAREEDRESPSSTRSSSRSTTK